MMSYETKSQIDNSQYGGSKQPNTDLNNLRESSEVPYAEPRGDDHRYAGQSAMQEVWKAAQQAGLMRQLMDHEHFIKLQGSYVKLSKARNRLANER